MSPRVLPWTLLGMLAATGLQASGPAPAQLELLGFGEGSGPRSYTSRNWETLRYRIVGASETGIPLQVVFRRDDGATVVVPGETRRNQVLRAEVPLRAGGFTWNEYEAFLVDPQGGIQRAPGSLGVVRVDAGLRPERLAATLEQSRNRLERSGDLGAPPALLAEEPTFDPSEAQLTRLGAFDAPPVPGEDLDRPLGALD